MIQDDCIVICYPAGSGGSFLYSAINHITKNLSLKISQTLGHCHENKLKFFPKNFISGDSLTSFEEELTCIKNLQLSLSEVYSNHYRNLIAIQHRGIEQHIPVWFIKINVDSDNDNQVEFTTQMLYRKTTRVENLSTLYDQIRHHSWPATAEEYIKWDPLSKEFLKTIYHGLKSWYWVENHFTQQRTINLSLLDIFVDTDLAHKLSPWFEPGFVERFQKLHSSYIDVNRRLHPDLYKLIEP
jgi:hypothetical protein